MFNKSYKAYIIILTFCCILFATSNSCNFKINMIMLRMCPGEVTGNIDFILTQRFVHMYLTHQILSYINKKKTVNSHFCTPKLSLCISY